MEAAALEQLREMGLDNYHDLLVENGFDCVQALALLDQDDLSELSSQGSRPMKLGEKKRILKLAEVCKEIMNERRSKLSSTMTMTFTNLNNTTNADSTAFTTEVVDEETKSANNLAENNVSSVKKSLTDEMDTLLQKNFSDEEEEHKRARIIALENNQQEDLASARTVRTAHENSISSRHEDAEQVGAFVEIQPEEQKEVPAEIAVKEMPADGEEEIVSLTNDEPEALSQKNANAQSSSTADFVQCCSCKKSCTLFFAENVAQIDATRVYCGQCMKKSVGNVMFLSTSALDDSQISSTSKTVQLMNRPILDPTIVKKVHVGVLCSGTCSAVNFIERTRFVCIPCLEKGVEINLCFRCAALHQVHDKSHPLLSVPQPLDVFPETLDNLPEIIMHQDYLTLTTVLKSQNDVRDLVAYLLRNQPTLLKKAPALFQLILQMLIKYSEGAMFRFHLDGMGNGGMTRLSDEEIMAIAREETESKENNRESFRQRALSVDTGTVYIDKEALKSMGPRVARPIPKLSVDRGASVPLSEEIDPNFVRPKSPREFYMAGGSRPASTSPRGRNKGDEKNVSDFSDPFDGTYSKFDSISKRSTDPQMNSKRLQKFQAVAKSSEVKYLRTAEQRYLCRRAWNVLTENPHKHLSQLSLVTSLDKCGYVFPKPYLKYLFSFFDADRDGFIGYSEFSLLFTILYNYSFCMSCMCVIDGACFMCRECGYNPFIICESCYGDMDKISHKHNMDDFDKRNGFEVRSKIWNLKQFRYTSTSCRDLQMQVDNSAGKPCRLLTENVVLKDNLWQCVDCKLDEKNDHIICNNCAETCHKGHKTEPSDAQYGICDCVQEKCGTFPSADQVPVRCFKCSCYLDSFFTSVTLEGLEVFCQNCIGDMHYKMYFPSQKAFLDHADKAQMKFRLNKQVSMARLETSRTFVHWGVQCDGKSCRYSVIEGVRYVCAVCLEKGVSVNLCRECCFKGEHDDTHPLSVLIYPEERALPHSKVEELVTIALTQSCSTKMKVKEFDEESLWAIVSYFAKNSSGSFNRNMGGFFQAIWLHCKREGKSLAGCSIKFHDGGIDLYEIQSEDRTAAVFSFDMSTGLLHHDSKWVNARSMLRSVTRKHTVKPQFKLDEISDELTKSLNV